MLRSLQKTCGLPLSVVYLLGEMVKLAPRVFLLCWVLFSSNSSFIKAGQVPIILIAPTLKY